MNTQVKTPAGPDTKSESPGEMVILRLNLPEEGVESFLPKNNFIGTIAMLALLQSALRESGLSVELPCAAGPLNRSFYCFRTNNPHEAARALVKALGEIALETRTRIYRLDSAEEIMRCIYPAAGDVADLAELKRELDAGHSALLEAVNTLKQILGGSNGEPNL